MSNSIPVLSNVILVTRRTHFPTLISRVDRCLDRTPVSTPIVLVAAGAAIVRACDLALAVGRTHGGSEAVNIDVDTTTQYVTDHFESLNEVCFCICVYVHVCFFLPFFFVFV